MPEVRRRRTTKPTEDTAPAEDEASVTEIDATTRTTRTRRRDRADEPEAAEPEATGEDDKDWDTETADVPASSAPEPEPEPEPAPSRRNKPAAATKPKLPPGVHTGRAGVEAVRKARGDGSMRMQLGSEPELVAFLEDEPFATFSQHWVSQGGGGGNRPYTCPEDDCPICEMGDRPNQQVYYNVLHLSADNGPKNMILPLGVRAARALDDAATSKKTGKPDILKDFFAVSKSGSKQQTQTNFRPIKEEDIVEDWIEILDNFKIEDLDDIIEESLTHLFDVSVVQVTPPKQLREVAAYLAED